MTYQTALTNTSVNATYHLPKVKAKTVILRPSDVLGNLLYQLCSVTSNVRPAARLLSNIVNRSLVLSISPMFTST